MNRKIVKIYNDRMKATKSQRDITWTEFVAIVNENRRKNNGRQVFNDK